ncbi:MAG TPA: sugar ABC transporter substrate-binding protein, partial [Planctomycetaceae bacterium]|nr:sugar ABC transporter substrate-binding protein [Planctomycetaceae bacterium]
MTMRRITPSYRSGTALVGLMILLVAMAVGVIGCAKREAPSGSSDRPRVALIMKSLANEFFTTMAEGARRHHGQHADEYDLIVNGIKDERDLARQSALVEEMMASRVDAIVIAPADSKALAPVLKRAQQAGIVVINIDNKLDESVLKDLGIQIPFV